MALNVNMGVVDRAVRVTIATVLLWLTATETIGAWGYIGLLPLFTATLGHCPLYVPFGLSTRRPEKG